MTRYIVKDGNKIIGMVTVPTQKQTGGTRRIAERFAKEKFQGNFIFVQSFGKSGKQDQQDALGVGIDYHLTGVEDARDRFALDASYCDPSQSR